ncbi:Acyl-CoA Delta(11) desaturase [Bienertia sinuspersici]
MASTLLLIIVFVLDLIAFALAVAAEQRRSTATLINAGTEAYCQYDSDISTGLGAGAIVLLLASQLLIMFASRCLCCGRGLRPGGSRTWAIILFISCWVFFIIAEVCLLAGSVRNAYHTKYRSVLNSPPTCQTLRKGFLQLVLLLQSSLAYSPSFTTSATTKPAVDFPISHGGDTGVRMGNL